MIKVSKLKISGFKSFAFPSEIEIQDGVTGIIGPNGCGKSNVFEAIRWVMGESSSKSLRSGSMDELIFSGTEKVPAKNIAEVNIYLEKLSQDDNFSNEQIIVSRMIERGVGSFYKINNRDVRAKDILVLFSDTGSGSRSSSIIGQGNIDQIINFKPIERKIILEEAAGTSGLQSRRHESELKLSATESNLDRLSDTIYSLQNQEKSLSRQARQADKYEEMTNKIKKNESKLFYQEWNQFESEYKGLTKRSQELNEIIKISNDKLKDFENKKIKIESTYNTSNSSLLDLERERQLKSSEKNILLNKKDSLLNRKQDILYALEIIEKDTINEKNKLKEFNNKISKINVEIQNFSIENLKKKLGDQHKEDFNLREKLKMFESNLADEMQLVLGEEFKQDTIKESKDFLDKKKNQLTVQANELNKKIIAMDNYLKNDRTNEFKEIIETRVKQIENKKKEVTKLANLRNKLFKESTLHQIKIENTNSKITELNTEINTLKNLEKKIDTDKNIIFNQLKIKKGYENAVYSVLENELNSNISQYTKKWTKKEIDELKASENSLRNYVTYPSVLEAFLSQIIVLEDENLNLNNKKLQVGQILVTKKGDFKRWDGFTKNKNSKDPNWYDYREIIQKLNTELKKFNEILHKLHDERKKYEELINKNELTRKNIILEKDELDKKLEEIVHSQRKFQEERAFKVNSFEKLNENYEFLKNEILSINTELNKIIKNDEQTANDKNEEKKSNTEKIKLNIKNIQSKIDEKRIKTLELNEKILSMEINFKYLKNDLEQNKEFKTQSEGQLLKLEERFKKYNHEKDELSKSPAELELKILNIDESIKNLIKKSELKNLEVSKIKKEITRINEEIKKIDILRADRQTELVRNEENQFHLNEKKNNLRNIVFERLKCNPEEIIEHYSLQNEKIELIGDLKESLQRLNIQREQMGPVNLRANIEKKQITERIEEYELEKNDLDLAIQKLRVGINQINNEGKKKLLNAFELVNKNFGKLFQKLFEGGNASLELVASEDPLQTGIEIFARPPGKKLTSINLLSGGEKTLTAIALIFSIFLINPSPICVLDEVDAALDDSNVEKFCELLNEIKNNTKTKFLIISHHKTTMSMVDRVYGITMTQKGISDIVSVDFADNNYINAVK